jgi:glycosyltransferase involved in cell wall biosynthesis
VTVAAEKVCVAGHGVRHLPTIMYDSPRIALAHHWLVGMRGGEKVLEQLCLLFPDAPIYTLVSARDKLSETLRSHPIHESWMQRLPQGRQRYKSLLPFFPLAIGNLRVEPEADFLFSTDASVIKGLAYGAGTPHVCYCHSPPRYLWEMQETYLRQTGGLGPVGRALFKAVTPGIRTFDRAGADRVTHFIANSHFVQERIKASYERESEVIYPPVDVDAFDPTREAEDFYLIVTELVAYKRVDLAIDAFNRTGKRLVVLGDGPEAAALRARSGPNIEFLGRQPFTVLKDRFERCRAFIYPQIEDFGITAVEAQAAGRPVIAFRRGGALETVVEGSTGMFFDEQTPESLAECVEAFEERAFSAAACRANAENYRPEAFRDAVRNFLTEKFPALFPAGWTSVGQRPVSPAISR